MEDFNKIYAKSHKSILNFILRKVNSQVIAEELTNDVFMKVYNHLENYDESRSTMNTWIMNITSNTIIDYYRKKKLETLSLDKEIFGDYNGDKAPTFIDRLHSKDKTPFEKISISEGVEHIQDVIGDLPEKYALIAELFFNQEYSYEEIAKRLDVPLGTVKGQISRARKLLTSKLQRI